MLTLAIGGTLAEVDSIAAIHAWLAALLALRLRGKIVQCRILAQTTKDRHTLFGKWTQHGTSSISTIDDQPRFVGESSPANIKCPSGPGSNF